MADLDERIKEHDGPARHNHVTRDIKSPGMCAACDEYHAARRARKAAARKAHYRPSNSAESTRIPPATSGPGGEADYDERIEVELDELPRSEAMGNTRRSDGRYKN